MTLLLRSLIRAPALAAFRVFRVFRVFRTNCTCVLGCVGLLIALGVPRPAQAWQGSTSSRHVAQSRKKPRAKRDGPPWTLGSPSTAVLRAQGPADYTERLVSLGYDVWHYDASWVRLSTRDDRVIAWANNDGALAVELGPSGPVLTDPTFARGSTRDDVLRLHGTPTVYAPQTSAGIVVLQFGTATVQVSDRDNRVLSWSDPTGRSLKVRPEGTVAAARSIPKPVAPASLAATILWNDASGDGYLDSGEQARITLTVKNIGSGTAYAVMPALLNTEGWDGLRVLVTERADSIAPGHSVTIALRIVGESGLEDSRVQLLVGVHEGNGFDLEPSISLDIPTRRARAPKFVLDGVAINDQSGNGRIEPREIVEVTARVSNHGEGEGHAVRFVIAPGTGVTLTPDSKSTGQIGTLRPGESRDLRFSAFSNSRASGFPVEIALHEERARYDTTLALPLGLDRPVNELPSLVVRGRKVVASAAPSLVSPVDTGIPQAPRRGNVVAAVFGAERYEHAPETPLARRDAAVFREYVRKVFGVGDDDSRLLFRTDDEVSGTELRRTFGEGGWLARRVSAETDVVVYWAGHGVTDPKTHKAYLLPNDGDPSYPAQTGYALDELYDRLAALGARSVTVFVDACFSGRARDGAAMVAGARGVVVSLENPAVRAKNMSVFSAARGDQLANSWPEGQHGVFTYALLAGLRGAADANHDGTISSAELAAYIAREVPRTAARIDREQTPEFVSRDPARAVVILK